MQMGGEEAQGYEVSADLQSLEDAHANCLQGHASIITSLNK
jgi:hypothetical protein